MVLYVRVTIELYNINKSIMTIEDEINALYIKILQRPVDESGLKQYTTQIKNNKLTLQRLERLILRSQEYKNLTSNTTQNKQKHTVKQHNTITLNTECESSFNINELKTFNKFILIQNGNSDILTAILKHINDKFNNDWLLFISSDVTMTICDIKKKTHLKNILLIKSPNYGMDIGKFFHQLFFLKSFGIESIDCAIKLHTKQDITKLNIICDSLLKSKFRIDLLQKLIQQKYDFIGPDDLIISQTNTHRFKSAMCPINTANVNYILENWFDSKFDNTIHRSFYEGTMFWFSNYLYQKLISLNIEDIYKYFEFGRTSDNQLIEHAWERVFSFLCYKNILSLKNKLNDTFNVNFSAIYFPQYHYNEENDKYWGKNFTEWTLLKPNASKYNLNIPHDDIGYYNLMDSGVIENQCKLAKSYDIQSFLIYHYWFDNKPVLNKPIEKIMELNDNKSIEFFLSWANESWTRIWDGGNNDVMIQQYFDESKYDMENHFKYLLKFFNHTNYKKINNKPVFVIYKCDEMKTHFDRIISYFNEQCINEGYCGIHIILTYSNFDIPPEILNNDLVQEVFSFMPNILGKMQKNTEFKNRHKIYNNKTKSFNYEECIKLEQVPYLQNKKCHSGLFTSWNNSVRRINDIKNATVFDNSSPELFLKHIQTEYINTILKSKPHEEMFIFINAWNEWNEQAILEPSQKYKYQYLEQIKLVCDTF